MAKYFPALFCLVFGFGNSAALRAQGWAPTNLRVNILNPKQKVGGSAECVVQLTNSDWAPVAAKKNMVLLLETVLPTGTIKKSETTVKAGETFVKIPIPVTEPGVFEVRASQRELISSGDYFLGSESKARPTPVPVPSASPSPTATASPSPVSLEEPVSIHPQKFMAANALTVEKSVEFIPHPAVGRTLALVDGGNSGATMAIPQPVSQMASASPIDITSNSSSHPVHPKIHVELRYNPTGPLPANKKDQFTITAICQDEELDQDIALQLWADNGNLEPETVIIPKDRRFARCNLRSDFARSVWVSQISPANIELTPAHGLNLQFVEPITRLKVKPNPSSISLLETSSISVFFEDDTLRRTTTDVKRHVSLSVNAGGYLEPADLDVEAHKPEGKFNFLPTSIGAVTINASSDQLPENEAVITVTWPVLLLILSGLGGAIGGLLKFINARKKAWTDIVIGPVIGFVFYWALVFGLLRVSPALSHAVLLNPLVVLPVAILGGWTGVKLLDKILQTVLVLRNATRKPRSP